MRLESCLSQYKNSSYFGLRCSSFFLHGAFSAIRGVPVDTIAALTRCMCVHTGTKLLGIKPEFPESFSSARPTCFL